MAKDNYTAGNSKGWGVTHHRGARTTSLARGSEVHSTNRERELHWEFDYDDLPRFMNHAFTANMWIPDGAIVKDITFEVTEKFVGSETAQLQIGLMDSNGDILSYDHFGIVDKVVGKETGWQWYNNTGAPVTAGAQPKCDGQNFSLLHICAVDADGTPCKNMFTCGEARLTITMKTPFYAYHYDGKGVNDQVDCFSLIPNDNSVCEPCDDLLCYNPCLGAEYKTVTAYAEQTVELPLCDQEVPCPCPEVSTMDCTDGECPDAADTNCE